MIPFWVKPLIIATVLAADFGAGFYKATRFWEGRYNGIKTKYDGYVAEVKGERRKWNTEIAGKDRAIQEAQRLAQEGFSQQLATAVAQRDDFARRLRDQLAQRPALQPAQSAPAECGKFESTPQLLPEGDRRLLDQWGQVVARIVSERNECFAQYEAVRKAMP